MLDGWPGGMTADFDRDGKIDHIFFMFSEELKGASLSEDDITVEGYTVLSAKTIGDEQTGSLEDLGAEFEGTGDDGVVLIVKLKEGADEDTSATPAITIANNALFDLAGNAFAGLENVPAFDFAPPVATLETSSTKTNIHLQFSEEVSQVTLDTDDTTVSGAVKITFDPSTSTVAEIEVDDSGLNDGDVIKLEIEELSLAKIDIDCILTWDGTKWNVKMGDFYF
ncbi:hypothetical protein CD798_15985 [Bacillaceae bacterium SAOS 7]|nr:hypothetical protein CD798_15985 [Bacillaceae bacterium SAOS 7]